MKAFDFKVAKYAKALVRIGVKNDIVDSLNADIKSLEVSLSGQKDYVLDYILTNSVIQELENKGINVYLARILRLMKSNKDINLLRTFFYYWDSLYKKQSNIMDIEVYSVIELSKVQASDIKEILQQKFQKSFKVKNIIKKDILGGLIIKVGSYIFDDSFFSKLSSLKRENEV